MSAATSLLPGPRRAEQFARFVDGDQTPVDAGMARLVDIARGVAALPQPVGPRPEFRAALRQRLVAVASVQAMQADVPEQRRSPEAAPLRARRVQRRIALASAAVTGVVAMSGVGVAASRSLPGDPLYSIKTAAESVHLWFTSGAYDRGRLHLEFAQTRMDELQRLVAEGASAGTLTEALHDMDAETLAGSRDLTRAFAVDHRRDALRLLDRFTERQREALRAVLPELPTTARPAAQASLQLLATVVDRTAALARLGAATVGATTGTGAGSTGSSSGTPLQDQLGVVPKPLQSLTNTLQGLLPGTQGQTPTGGTQTTPQGTTGTDTGGSQTQPSTSSDIGSDLGSTIGGVIGNLPQPSPTSSSASSEPLPLPLPSVSLGLPLGDGSTSSPAPSPTSTSGGILPTAISVPLPGVSSITVPLP